MSKERRLPQTGYVIDKIYSNRQILEHRVPKPESSEGEIGFGWDWRIINPTTFEVWIRLTVDPTSERQEFVDVAVVGRFRQVDKAPSVAIKDFVTIQAPAILMPYARQIVSTLTNSGFYDPFHLPPINVQRLMQDFDYSLTTGARDSKTLPKKLTPVQRKTASRKAESNV